MEVQKKKSLTNHMCKISQLAPDSVCLRLWYVKLFSLMRMLLLTVCLKHSDRRVSTLSWTGKEGLMRLNITHNEVMLEITEPCCRVKVMSSSVCSATKEGVAPRGPIHVIRSATPTQVKPISSDDSLLALNRPNAWIMQTDETCINSTFIVISVMLRVSNEGEEKCESGGHLFTAVLFTELCNFLNLPNDHLSCE